MAPLCNILFVCLVFNLISADTKRILAVFPTPSISHQVVFRPLTQELAKIGHEVVVLTPDPAFPKGEAPANLTEIDVHDISYTLWKERFLATATGKSNDIATQMQVAIDLLTIIFEKQVLSDDFQKILKENDTFDLLITEACVRPALSLSHVIKVPVIQASSLGAVFDNFKTIGAPTHPLLYPLALQQRINNRTLWEKVKELYNDFRLTRLFAEHEKEENEMVKRLFGEDTPTLSELSNNVHMLFVNLNPIFEGNYPVPPTVVYMGRLHQKPEKELPQELKSYLGASNHGVIYMSFGTNTNPSSLPPEKIQIFVKVFSQLPYDILWKWDKDELAEKPKNVRIGKWFPQSDLLRHPKVKLFVTQGGLQSTDEAITAGVPLVGIPMLGDQWFNTEKYVHHGIGVKLDLETLTEESFRAAIDKVIKDKSYRHNIKRLDILMKDQPQPPLQRAVWWVEYVLRHGGAGHLRAPAANISWAQYYEVEFVLTVLSIVMLAVIVSVGSIYCLWLLATGHSKSKKIKDS